MVPPPRGLIARFRGRLGAFVLDAAFEAPARGVTALFGPSGCGKTTVLRAIAGLLRLEDGFLEIRGEVWQDGAAFRPVHRRPIGYVFQEPSLFPHLDVRRNLDYGRRRALRAGDRETIRFDDVVELLGLARLLARAPGTLSGGERQRVALGRALLTQPQLLLMDEPLSALDRFAKEEILPYLERLRDTIGPPTLYVSHDIAEVERLADHVVLMAGGRVTATAPLAEAQASPDLPLARMPEASVTLAAEVVAYDAAYDLTTLAVPGARLVAPGRFGPPGSRRRLRIAAQDVALVRGRAQASSILNCVPARILQGTPLGRSMMTVVLALGDDGSHILSRITRRSWDELSLGPGQPVFAQIKGVALVSPPHPEAEG